MFISRRAATAALAAVLVLGPLTEPALAAPPARDAASVQSKSSSIRTWAKQQWGSFPTWTRSGTGDDVIRIPKGIRGATVHAKHDGDSNFVVWALDRKNEQSDLLVNEIGVYDATTAFDLEDRSAVRGLEINADGAWTITLKPIAKAPLLAKRGSGPGVYLLGSHGTAVFTHDGDSNFVVTQHTGGRYGSNLLVNEIGRYRGKVRLDRGRSVIVIDADGRWSATPR